MARETPCLTPGGVYSIHIGYGIVSITVTGNGLLTPGDEAEARVLEDLLHNAVETVLCGYWVPTPVGATDAHANDQAPSVGATAPDGGPVQDIAAADVVACRTGVANGTLD